MSMRQVLGVVLITLFDVACGLPVWGQPAAGSTDQQAVWPDTRAGRWGKAFVEAFNAPGEEALRGFIMRYYSPGYLNETSMETELTDYLKMRQVTGGLTVYQATDAGECAVDLVVRSTLRGWWTFHFELSPEPPHDLAKMSLNPSSAPSGFSSPNELAVSEEITGKDADWSDLRNLLERIREDAGIPALGAAIVHEGKIIEVAVKGVRRIDRLDRVQIGDKFHIASLTKLLTATLIGKLLEQGVLRWDMTLGDALQDIPMRGEYRSVTLEQLLRHRGGVPSAPSAGEFADGLPAHSGRPPEEARASLVRQVLTEAPVKLGERSYSNAGYVVAAYLAERVTKTNWEELIRSLVFEPLDLKSAGFGWPVTASDSEQPSGHLGVPPGFGVQAPGSYVFGDMDYMGPAGNVHCSIEDLARYARFHLDVLKSRATGLRAETLRRILEIGDADNVDVTYDGTGGTFYAVLAIYPAEDLGIVAVANCGHYALPSLKALRDAVRQRMMGHHVNR